MDLIILNLENKIAAANLAAETTPVAEVAPVRVPCTNPIYEDVRVQVPKIVRGADRAVAAFKRATASYVFATVCGVNVHPAEPITTAQVYPDSTGKLHTRVFPLDQTPVFTEDERIRSIEEHASKFSLIVKSATGTGAGTSKDRVAKATYTAHSNNQAHWNPVTFRFVAINGASPTLLPRVGERVCGLPYESKGRNGRESLRYWFVCSEQFYRFVRAINSDGASLAKEFGTDPEMVRRKLFAGNTLNTFAYGRWLMACHDHHLASGNSQIESTPERIEKLFYWHRFEALSLDFPHIYSALTLILLFGELPCQGNVPFNRDLGPVCKTWELPEGWIEAVVNTYGLVTSLSAITVSRVANVPAIPNGTRLRTSEVWVSPADTIENLQKVSGAAHGAAGDNISSVVGGNLSPEVVENLEEAVKEIPADHPESLSATVALDAQEFALEDKDFPLMSASSTSD